jgi:hypothetical protein
MRYGGYVVLGEAEPSPGGYRRVRVRCDCGLETTRSVSQITDPEIKGCYRCYGDRIRMDDYPGMMGERSAYSTYQKTASKRGYCFEIDRDDFRRLTSQPCTYCGALPGNTKRDRVGGGVFVYNGLDRVDSARGYTLDNVVPACFLCNAAKRDMSVDDFIAWARRVVAHADGRQP